MLNREIRLGEVFVALSVLLLLVGLVALWNQDHRLKRKEHADRIRHSAAAVGAKVERWPDLEDRFFEGLEPTIVDVSEKVAQSHSTEPANRILYKALADAKGKSSQRWLDEQLELSFAELEADLPEAGPVFRHTLGALQYAEERMYGELSTSLQAVLRDDVVLKLKESPEIGNILRTRSAEKRSVFLSQVRDISKPLQQEMKSILQMSESNLLNANARASILTHPSRSESQPAPPDS